MLLLPPAMPLTYQVVAAEGAGDSAKSAAVDARDGGAVRRDNKVEREHDRAGRCSEGLVSGVFGSDGVGACLVGGRNRFSDRSRTRLEG